MLVVIVADMGDRVETSDHISNGTIPAMATSSAAFLSLSIRLLDSAMAEWRPAASIDPKRPEYGGPLYFPQK